MKKMMHKAKDKTEQMVPTGRLFLPSVKTYDLGAY